MTAWCRTARCRSWSNKRAVDVDNDHPEKTIEGLFGANGWGAMWRNGVYDYLHYHATVHEVLGVARGNAMVRFGGDKRHGACDRRRRRRDPARRYRASMPVFERLISLSSAPIRPARPSRSRARRQRTTRRR